MDVKLDFQPDKPQSTRGTLIVYSEDESTTLPLCCDTFDIANEKRRAAFINKLTKEYPAIAAKKVEQALLEHVVRIITDRRKAGEKTDNEQDVNILEITPQEVKDLICKIMRLHNLFLRHKFGDGL